MTKNRHYFIFDTDDKRDVYCKFFQTLKNFNIIGYRSRIYVNWPGNTPHVDVIYEG